jgi:hypothetical protein
MRDPRQKPGLEAALMRIWRAPDAIGRQMSREFVRGTHHPTTDDR